MIKKLGRNNSKSNARQPRLEGNYRSQPIFSYRAARSGADRQFERGKKPAVKVNYLKHKLKQLPYLISIIAICSALLYNLTLTPDSNLSISGDQAVLRPKEAYQDAIDKYLNSSIMNRTKITINTSEFRDTITRQFPEIEEINISLPLLRHQPNVSLRLAEPAIRLATPTAVYILDGSGRALFDEKEALPDFDTDKLPVITDPSGQQITLGKPALTRQQITYANQISSQASAKQMMSESMALEAGGEELHVRFKGARYLVKFSFGTDARQSFGAFLAARERLDQDRVAISEYVDVRIPERVYTK